MSPFKQKVIEIIHLVPPGKVVSYGQVAAYAGAPRAAREVGWILRGSEGQQIDLPWWRVVNNKGYLSIRGHQTVDKALQKKLLEAEGIVVSKENELNLERYRYRISVEELKKLQLNEDYIENLLAKYSQ